MEPKFVNGCSVNRVWGDSTTELIAAFQYEMGAVEFAKMQAKDDKRPANVFYVVSNHCNGKVIIVRPPAPLTALAKRLREIAEHAINLSDAARATCVQAADIIAAPDGWQTEVLAIASDMEAVADNMSPRGGGKHPAPYMREQAKKLRALLAEQPASERGPMSRDNGEAT